MSIQVTVIPTSFDVKRLVPTGNVAITFFVDACPSGWSEYTALRGRYPVGVPSGGTILATVGTAMSNSEDRAVGQHTHTFSGSALGTHNHSGSFSGSALGTHNHTQDDHDHALGVTSANGNLSNPNNNFLASHTDAYHATYNGSLLDATAVQDKAATNQAITAGTPAGSITNVAITAGTPAGSNANSGSVASTNAPYIQLVPCTKD